MNHHFDQRGPRSVSTRRTRRFAAAALASGALVLGTTVAATSLTFPGTPGKDVHIGGDNDNADNAFIQPPGVVAKQHMDNTDVLFGRANDDLLIGKLGDDTLLGAPTPTSWSAAPRRGPSPTATSCSATQAPTSTSGRPETAATRSSATRAGTA